MTNEYRTVYQGSARGAKGIGKTQAPKVSQDILKKPQVLASAAASTEQDFSRVITQQAAELKRQDTQQTLNENKELNDLKQLNQDINNFFMTSSKTVGKDYVAEKRQQGIDLARKAAAGDPEALKKLELDQEQLNEIEEKIKQQEENIDRALTKVEEGEYRTTLEEKMKAQNIRRLGSNVKFGYIRGTLIESGKGYSDHLQNTLATSEAVIPGTDIVIGSYHSQSDPKIRKAIIDYVESQFIEQNNPYGANEKAVRTYLTKSVVEQTDKFQELEAERWKRENADAKLEDITNNIGITFENFDNDPDAAIASIERLFTNGRRIMINRGIKGNAGGAVKDHILKEIPEALSRIKDPELRQRIVDAISSKEFTITGQGSKTLEGHWGKNEWNVDEILAKADEVAASRISKKQVARTVLLKKDLRDLQLKVEGSEMTLVDYQVSASKLLDTYDDVFEVRKIIDEGLKWKNHKMTREQSENYVRAILASNNTITEKEALFIDKEYRDELRKDGFISDYRFGEEFPSDKAKKKVLVESLTAHVARKYDQTVKGTASYDKNSILNGDTQKVIASLSKDFITTADSYLQAGRYVDANGQEHMITNAAQAMEAAYQTVTKAFDVSIDDPNSKYYLTNDGFSEIGGIVGDKNSTKETHRNYTNKLNELKVASQNSSSDLIANTDLSWIPDSMLEPTKLSDGAHRVDSVLLNLQKIDALHGEGNRDVYQIIDLLRAKRGLDSWGGEISKEAAKFRKANNQTSQSIKKRIAESIALGDTKGTELALDDMGLVNVGRMTNSSKQQTPFFSLGNNFENLAVELERANLPNMTLSEFQNDDVAQSKLNQFLVNDMMTQAEKLTNDKNEMIRLTAVGMKFGPEAMANYKAVPEQVQHASNVYQSYISGANIEGTADIAAVSESDIVITKVDPVQVDTSGYGTLSTITPGWEEKAILTPDQRIIFEEPIATDLAGAKAQLAKINSTEGPLGTLRGNNKIESQAAKNWEARKERLRNQVQALEIISSYSPSTHPTLGGISGAERMKLFHPQYGTVTRILGTERLNDLKNQAYINSNNAPALSNAYEEALMNLIRSQPEFGNMEMF